MNVADQERANGPGIHELSMEEIDAVSGGFGFTARGIIDGAAAGTGAVLGAAGAAAYGAQYGGAIGAVFGGPIGYVAGASIGAIAAFVVADAFFTN